MKKLLTIMLVLTMIVTLFASCDKGNSSSTPEVNKLESAKSYIDALYKKTNGSKTAVDFDVVGVVRIDGVAFNIEWTVDAPDYVAIEPAEDGKTVTVNVNEKPDVEVNYTLTATVKDEEGNTASCAFKYLIPAFEGEPTYADLVNDAYALADGEALPSPYRLFGEVISIDTAWSDEYKNITVTIVVDGLTEQPIQCYRLKGDGAEALAVGDKITVEGTLKNYKGTIEFDAGCTLVGLGEHPSQAATLDAAYALADGKSIPTPSVLKGEIISVDTAWSDEYKNITVTMVVDGNTEKPVQCYRLKGDGAEALAVGDVITVVGTLKNYKGTIEFDAGCTLTTASISEAKALFEAYTIEDGASATAPTTLTGTIATIDTEYSAEYKNITVTIVVGGLEDYKIMCYRLSGEGAEALAVGDVITVTGTIKNYKGTIEFDQGCTFTK